MMFSLDENQTPVLYLLGTLALVKKALVDVVFDWLKTFCKEFLMFCLSGFLELSELFCFVHHCTYIFEIVQ